MSLEIIFIRILNKMEQKINLELDRKFIDTSKNEKTNVRKCHSAIFRIMRLFDHLCRKYDIRYWICGGTLIGAYYHKGFKPTAHDADFSVEEKDFKKILKILSENLISGLFVEVINPIHFRIHDFSGKQIEGNYTLRENNGVFVDVALSRIWTNKTNLHYKCQMDAGRERVFDSNILFPLKEYLIEGHKFLGPSKPIKFLEQFDLTHKRINFYRRKLPYFKRLRKKYDKNLEITAVNFMKYSKK